MVAGRVSIIIPARNEKFLQVTIDDLLVKARGDVEILPVLDGPLDAGGYQPLRDDPRVKPIHKSTAEGMRPAINDAAQLATGQYLMKCDAHCIFGEGYDEILKVDCAEDWLAVPTRHSIDGDRWTMKPRHWNYHILTYPYLKSMYGEGLHAVTFAWDLNKVINDERKHILVDDLLSAQGSCWFQWTTNFRRLGPLDHANLYFYQESQETMLRQWMTGGRCIINKKTWYGHLHKGNNNLHTVDGRIGRGFFLNVLRKRSSEAYSTDFWLHNRQPGATRTFVSLIEQFWPLIARMKDPRYAWPDDWQDFAKYKDRFENRKPEEIPAHI